MEPVLVDTHAHLDMKDFENDRDRVIKHAKEAGVAIIVTIGIDLESSQKAVELSQNESIYATVGVHPHDAKSFGIDKEPEFKELARSPKVVAIGEIGLDYYRNLSPKNIQKKVFSRMMELAIETNLPIVVHNRDAYEDTLELIKEYRDDLSGGVIHCFSGDKYWARKFLDIDFYLSIPGIVTFSKAAALQEVVKWMPIEKMLIETDAPFLAPHPYRGKRNEPAYVKETALCISELKRISFEKIAEQTTENAYRIFKMDK